MIKIGHILKAERKSINISLKHTHFLDGRLREQWLTFYADVHFWATIKKLIKVNAKHRLIPVMTYLHNNKTIKAPHGYSEKNPTPSFASTVSIHMNEH